MNVRIALGAVLTFSAFIASEYTYPDFTYNPDDWPSVDGSNVAVGYAPIPEADTSITGPIMAKLTSKNSKLAVKETQECTDSVAQLAQETCWWTCDTSCLRKGDIHDCNGAKSIGLTFDDGPTDSTKGLVDYLVKNKLKATFFLVGSNMVKNPDMVKYLFENGMELGVHTWSHHPLTTETNEQVILEIEWTVRAFKAILGDNYTPQLARPPFGDIDDRVREIFKVYKLTPVIWNIDTDDWTISDPADTKAVNKLVTDFKKKFASTAHPNGFVVLEHDYSPDGITLAETKFIPMYKGYKIQSIGQCKNLQY